MTVEESEFVTAWEEHSYKTKTKYGSSLCLVSLLLMFKRIVKDPKREGGRDEEKHLKPDFCEMLCWELGSATSTHNDP